MTQVTYIQPLNLMNIEKRINQLKETIPTNEKARIFYEEAQKVIEENIGKKATKNIFNKLIKNNPHFDGSTDQNNPHQPTPDRIRYDAEEQTIKYYPNGWSNNYEDIRLTERSYKHDGTVHKDALQTAKTRAKMRKEASEIDTQALEEIYHNYNQIAHEFNERIKPIMEQLNNINKAHHISAHYFKD